MSRYKWTFIDGNGNFVTNDMYDDVRDFHEGFCAAKKDGFWGYIDRTGTWIVPPRYIECGDFHEGLASVCTSQIYSKNAEKDIKLFGYIDKTGTLVIEDRYHFAGIFREGLAEVHSYGEKGSHELVELITRDGTAVHRIYDPELKFHYMNDEFSDKFDISGEYFHEGYASVEKDGWLGLLTVDGTFMPAMKKEFENWGLIGPMRDGLAIMEIYHEEYDLLVVKGKKISVISEPKAMSEMIKSAGFVQHCLYLLTDEEEKQIYKRPEDCDLIRFESENKHRYGFKNKSGNIVIAPILFETRRFSEGLCAVQF